MACRATPGLLANMSQSTFSMIGALVITADTLVCTHKPQQGAQLNYQLCSVVRPCVELFFYTTVFIREMTDQNVHGAGLEVVVMSRALLSRDVHEMWEPFPCLALAVIPENLNSEEPHQPPCTYVSKTRWLC